MIRSEREYCLTRAQMLRFKEALQELMENIALGRPLPEGVDPRMPEIERRALESQVEELQAEMHEWEQRRHD